MSPLQQEVLLQMRLRGFADSTAEAYIHAMKELWQFHRRPLEKLSCKDVQLFLDEIITVRKRAWATVNVYFSALRFLYGQVLKRTVCEFSIPPRGRSGRRPGVQPPPSPPEGESAPEQILRLTGVDVTLCPACKAGHLIFISQLPRARDGPA